MNLLKKITNVITSLIIFSLVLLPNNIYSMQNNEKIPKEVIIGGELLQIEMQTNKIMVYGVNDNNKLENYDLIESISGDVIKKIYNTNEIKITSRSEVVNILLNMNESDQVNLEILRDNKKINIKLSKIELNHSYLTEKIPYCATLTYIDEKQNSFGAVAHTLDSKETENILTKKGDIYLAKLNNIQKSKKEFIGNMSGEKVYDKQGKVNQFSDYGIKGQVCASQILKNKEVYKVADPKDVRTGIAYLVIKNSPNEDKIFYEIEVTKVNKQSTKDINSFEFTLKDKRLINEYGGIVQGMSGCPIIQNGKLIGALSHVKTNDTKNGVGLYIKWMMED